MELIERYLQAVKFALPQAQRDDIIKELRDNILSQIEEKEAELGHPLDGGRAGRAAEKTRQPDAPGQPLSQTADLIGATMFPIYWKILKASLGLALLVLAVASIATAAAGKTFMESLGVCSAIPASR